MKKTLTLILASLAMINLGGIGNAATPWSDVDIDVEDLGPQEVEVTEPTAGPITIQLLGDYIGRAKVKCPGTSHLIFGTSEADISAIYYYNPCYKEGLTAGVAYTFTHLHWKYNPFFSQQDYSMITLNLGAFTMRLPDWTWRAQVSTNFDNIEHWNFSDYMTFDLLLWGRYALCQNVGVHIGFIGLTGMKIDRVYPVVGFDWTYNSSWKLSLVFPVDISLTYTINPCWNLAIANRFFTQRHRAGKQEFSSESLWFYTTSGTEFAINWQPAKWIKANIHGGYNYGGHLKVANRHYKHGHRMEIDGAPYGGAEIDLNF